VKSACIGAAFCRISDPPENERGEPWLAPWNIFGRDLGRHFLF
jgi:hypothetical protein